MAGEFEVLSSSFREFAANTTGADLPMQFKTESASALQGAFYSISQPNFGALHGELTSAP